MPVSTPPDIRRWLLQLPPDSRRYLFFPCLWSLPESSDYVVWFGEEWDVLGGEVVMESMSVETYPATTSYALTPIGPAEIRHFYWFSMTTGFAQVVDRTIHVRAQDRYDVVLGAVP